MKILIISKIFPNRQEPTFGTFVFDETAELSKSHEVMVVAPVPWFPRWKIFRRWYLFSQIPLREKVGNIAVEHPRYLVFPKIGRSLYGISYFLGIRKTVEKIWQQFQFDAIIAHYAYPDGYAAAFLRSKYKRPLLLKVHGSDINEDILYRARRFGVLAALRKADRIIAVSQALQGKLLVIGIPDEKVKVIPNGINNSTFKMMDQMQCRRELALAPDKFYILFVGNLVPVKGVTLLIQAFHQFIEFGNSDVELLIIGDGRLRLSIEQAIDDKNLNQYVTMLGKKPHDQIPKWMNASDLLCLSSNNEGYPVVLIEAKSCGLPVLATNVGGVREIIDHNDFIVPPADIDALAFGLREMVKKVKQQPHGRVAMFFRSWKDVAVEMNSELTQLTNRHNPFG